MEDLGIGVDDRRTRVGCDGGDDMASVEAQYGLAPSVWLEGGDGTDAITAGLIPQRQRRA